MEKKFKIQRNLFSFAMVPALFLTSIGGLGWSRSELHSELQSTQQKLSEQGPETPLYLPSGQHLRAVTLGFDNFAADILWFNTLNYFGKQVRAENNLRWFGHMCDLVTDLDRKAAHTYEFCATLLSWVAKEPKQSVFLLTRAIQAEPTRWRYYYLRGFTYWYFLDKRNKARIDLEKASRLPEAPAFLASLASRLVASEQSPEMAIKFLSEMIQHSKDETAKEQLRKKLTQAKISRDIKILNKKLEQFNTHSEKKATEFSQLVAANLLRGNPLDPDGEPYLIDPKRGDTISSSGSRGLSFAGKTAKTGLARKIYAEPSNSKSEARDNE